MAKRPNFILFITDQQRADYLGCYGHPVLQTPHIDSIAANGVRFERFYVATPICMPNRATLMTGRMASLHGVRNNGLNLSLQANTFVDMLRTSGYRTALIGKSHLQNFSDAESPLLQATLKERRKTSIEDISDALKPAARQGRYDQERPPNWLTGENFSLGEPYYGFDHVRLCTRHGDNVGGHYYYWLRNRQPDAHKLRGRSNALPHDAVCPQAWRTAIPEDLYPTTYVADEAVTYLRDNAANAGGPFFMQVSFPDPHHPFTPPGRYWDMYSLADMRLPASFAPADPARQPHVAWLQQKYLVGEANRSGPSVFGVNAQEAREAMALTCGSISMIDDAVGRVLRELKSLGLNDDTVVAFTTDHGDFMGDHQLLLKGPLHFQGLIRVPFIWSDPQAQRKNIVTQGLGGTLDIASTILDRAGVEPYIGIQGQSLLPIMEDSTASGADGVLIEEDGQRTSYGFSSPVRCRSYVTRRWRFTIYHDVDWGELYDLENVPDELENLWFDPGRSGLKGDLALALARAQMAAADRSPLPTWQG